MRHAAALAISAALAFSLACGSDDGSPAPPLQSGSPAAATPSTAACADASLGSPGVVTRTLTLDGLERAYSLALPESYASSAAPLLIAIMPAVGAAEAVNDLRDEAVGEGYIVVLPGATAGGWNPADSSDAQFVSELLETLRASPCIDAERVFVAGFADGATMAQSLACAQPDALAALAMVSAAYLPCQEDMPLVAIHGSADAVVPYEGGPIAGVQLPPVHRSASEWARAAGCDGLPRISRHSLGVELSTFRRCRAGDGVVLLYTVLAGGHAWPGAGATSEEFSAAAAILDFFAAHSGTD